MRLWPRDAIWTRPAASLRQRWALSLQLGKFWPTLSCQVRGRRSHLQGEEMKVQVGQDRPSRWWEPAVFPGPELLSGSRMDGQTDGRELDADRAASPLTSHLPPSRSSGLCPQTALPLTLCTSLPSTGERIGAGSHPAAPAMPCEMRVMIITSPGDCGHRVGKGAQIVWGTWGTSISISSLLPSPQNTSGGSLLNPEETPNPAALHSGHPQLQPS